MDQGKSARGNWRSRLIGTSARVAVPLGVIGVVALLILSTGAASATTASPPAETHSTLATLPEIDAIAANSTNVFYQGVQNCSQIWTVNAWGTVSLYATVPVNSTCDEGSLALAPVTSCPSSSWSDAAIVAAGVETDIADWSHGGHGSGCKPCHQQTGYALYDIVDGLLFEITNGGANITLVDSFPSSNSPALNWGLTYDQVGDFNHSLIVTSSAHGDVWLVNSTGAVMLLTQLGVYAAGPAVAPAAFGTYAGSVLIAEKGPGRVVAVNSTGAATVVTNWTKADAVAFADASYASYGSRSGSGYGGKGGGGGCGSGYSGGCTFSKAQDVFFVANYSSGALEAFPASDFANFTNQGFVAGGLNHGIASFESNGTTTLFQSQTQRLSDIAFITCFASNSGGCGGGGGCGGCGWGWSQGWHGCGSGGY